MPPIPPSAFPTEQEDLELLKLVDLDFDLEMGFPESPSVDLAEIDIEEEVEAFGGIVSKVREKRINHIAKKIAKVHADGDEDKARKLIKKLQRVINKLQDKDPSWQPSAAVQSWLDWADRGGGAAAPNIPFAPSDDGGGGGGGGGGGWGDDSLPSDIAAVLNAPIYMAPGGGGYSSTSYRNAWEDPSYVLSGPAGGYPQGQGGQGHQGQRPIIQNFYGPRPGGAGPGSRMAPMGRPQSRPFVAGGGKPFAAARAGARFRGLPGIRELEPKLASKIRAYEEAKRRGHLKRAERLGQEIAKLSADLAQARSMVSYRTSVEDSDLLDAAFDFGVSDPSEILVEDVI